MNCNFKYMLCFIAITLVGTASADGGFTPNEAFLAMLKLEGKWSGEAFFLEPGQSAEEVETTDSETIFKIIGNSTVVQTIAPGTPSEMMSMYHQNGRNELIHQHYCVVGNQPSMRFKESDEEGAIDFRFSGGTNMDVNLDRHFHHHFIRIIDEDTFESRTEIWQSGKLLSTRYGMNRREK